MKRIVVRLVALSLVATAAIAVGMIALAQAQRDGGQGELAEPGRITVDEASLRPIPLPAENPDSAVSLSESGPRDPFLAPPAGAEPPYSSGGPTGYSDDIPPANVALGPSRTLAPSDALDPSNDSDDVYDPAPVLAQATEETQPPFSPAVRGESAPQAWAAERPAPNASSDAGPPRLLNQEDDSSGAYPAPVDEGRSPLPPRQPAPAGDLYDRISAPSSSGAAFADGQDDATPPLDTTTEGSGRPGPRELEGAQTASLVVEKSAPPEIQIGKPAIFMVRVRNVGQTTARNVTLFDDVPEGTKFSDANPRPTSLQGSRLSWSLSDLKPGDEEVVEIELTPVAEGEIGSVATVQFSAEGSVRTTATRPQLALKIDAPATVMIGDRITFSIRLSNPGTGAAMGVVLQEGVPEHLEHEAGAELEYEVGDLAPGESRDLQLTMTAVKAGRVANVITATADANLQVEERAEFEIVAPALAVGIEGPKQRYLDRKATYVLSVSNPGTASAREVALVSYLPEGMKFVEANHEGVYNPQTRSVHWLLEELPPQETGMVELTALPVEAGEQVVRVEGKAQQGLSATGEQQVLVEGVAAISFSVVDIADPVEVGGETTYEVHVTNQGTKASTNLRLAALLPEGLEPVDADGPSRHRIDGQRVLFEPLAQLAPKAESTYQIRAKGHAAGDMRVSVQVLTAEMQTPVTKEESTRFYADE